jgi:hypothetical protein
MSGRTTLPTLAAAFIALGSLRPGPAPARLICVRGPLSVDTEWAEDSLIVSGVPDSVTEVVSSEGFLERTISQVRVLRAYRGRPAATITVYSENDSGRFPMERGVGYVLFLSRWEDGHLHADNCGNSRPLARAANVLHRLRSLARQTNHP